MNSRTRARALDISMILVLGGLAALGAWLYRDFAQDDAFITYRYARNLAAGLGFFYNPGEPVLGTSTPLYTLALALGRVLSGQPIPRLSLWFSSAGLWLSAVALYYLGQPHSRPVAASAALLYLSQPLLLTSIGMETLSLNALWLITLLCYQRQRYGLTGGLLGALILMRYEMALFALLLCLHDIFIRHHWPRWVALALAPITLWLGYTALTFGVIMPQSATAKLLSPRIPFGLGALAWWQVYVHQTPWFNAFLPLLMLGIYSTFRRRDKSKTGYGLLLIWSGVYGLAALKFAGSFSWYYGPLLPGLAVLFSGGLDFVATLLVRLFANRKQFSASLLHATFIGLMVLPLLTLHVYLWTRGGVNRAGHIEDSRTEMYHAVSAWLDQHAHPTDTLAASEIGVLGYDSPRRIIDLYGLITPGLTPWLAAGLPVTLSHAITLYHPDYVLVLNQPSLTDRLTEDYVFVESFNGGQYYLFAKTKP